LTLRDDIRRRINNPGVGGWKPIAEANPETLKLMTDLIGSTAKMQELPTLSKTLDEILTGKQHVTDFDLLMIMRLHQCE